MDENEYDLTVPESVTNEELKKIAWDFACEGGNLGRLPKILGLSDERWEGFLEWLRIRTEPRQPDVRFPILIPETSPDLLHLIQPSPESSRSRRIDWGLAF